MTLFSPLIFLTAVGDLLLVVMKYLNTALPQTVLLASENENMISIFAFLYVILTNLSAETKLVVIESS
jgi:hypothetical protein